MKETLSNQILKWLILLALVLLIVSVVSFWFGGKSFSENRVAISIEGPTQASVGDEIAYKIKYANETKLDLKEMKFVFSFPEASIVLDGEKIDSELSKNFEVALLKPGQSGEKEFKGFLAGERGDIKEAKILVSFKAGSLKTVFEKSESLSTTIVNVPVPLSLTAPPNAVSGESVEYIFDYRNESGGDMADLQFKLEYPDGFTPKSFLPAPSGDNDIWNVNLLKRGSGGRITVRGLLSGKEGEIKTVTAVLRKKIFTKYADFEKTAVSTAIANPLLKLNLLVNDSKDYSAFAGDTLKYVLQYQNNSNFNLLGLELTVNLNGAMFDFSTLDSGGGFFDSFANTILWNAGSVPDFGNLVPNKRGQVGFSVILKPGVDISGSKNLFVEAAARLSTSNVPTSVGGNEVFATVGVTTKISAQPVFNILSYYNDQNFGSSGPLPPEVGEETVFTVHWQIINPGNDMSGVKASAILPAGVNWKNVTSVGTGQPEIEFNRNFSEVVWDLGVLPRGTGVSLPKYEAIFQVSVKPSSNQRNSPVTLLKNLRLSGTDIFTKQLIVVNVRDLDTNGLAYRPGEGSVK